MAKLYPPSIAGTLPSFYRNKNGTTNLVVPFSMNKTVSAIQIQDFSLRIKTTNTDILYGILTNGKWNSAEVANLSVSFTVPEEVLRKFVIGQFYKVQLAYIDINGETGFYSTVGIIKYTAQPEVKISGFDQAVNINKTEYIGVYQNPNDISEKVYEFKFDLYDKKDNLLETSGWILHNTYEDTSLTESHDKYIIRYNFTKDTTYKIMYSVRTNNNLEVNSPKYLVMNMSSIDPSIYAELKANLNYDNGCIDLTLKGIEDDDGAQRTVTGKFLLSRASSTDNYLSWLPISKFYLTGELPSAFLFRDYTVEHGATYIYSIQQENDYELMSNRLLSQKTTAYFEDAFLFDGERQLRIRFNPKVSSFKTVVLESKKNTIGSKFPFIFRNGIVEYKEFPINGLVSYMMDENEFFLSKEKDLYVYGWKNTTDIDDDNIALERRFKLEVLNWLNNGKVKLFRSPQEGNYIVRLMNVSMSPIDSTSRMLHNFNCQASEIASFTPDNLALYGLIDTKDIPHYYMRWETVILQDLYESLSANESIYDKDLLKGYGTYHVKITDMLQGTTISFMYEGETTPREIMIGATGAYEIVVDEPIYQLRILNKSHLLDDTTREPITYGKKKFISGSVTYSIMSSNQNQFDTIMNLTTEDIPAYQTFGPSENILAPFTNLKSQVSRIYYARFSKLEVREVYNSIFGTNEYINKKTGFSGGYLSGVIKDLIESKDGKQYIYDIQSFDKDNQLLHYYYRYVNGQIYASANFETLYPDPFPSKVLVEPLNEHTLYRANGVYYRVHGDRLIQEQEDWDLKILSNNNKYTMLDTDLTEYVVYLKKYMDKNGVHEEYYKFDGTKIQLLNNYSTKINYGSVEFDVNEKEVLYLEEMDDVPSKIAIGSGVCAELGMQVKHFIYSVENLCKNQKAEYEKALIEYNRLVLGVKKVTNTQSINQSLDYTYFILDDYFNFQTISSVELKAAIKNKIDIYQLVSAEEKADAVALALQWQQVLNREKVYLDAIQTQLDAEGTTRW